MEVGTRSTRAKEPVVSSNSDSLPLVSIIMGVYQCKNTDNLMASIKSIIRQTYVKWEFLIVDDGSEDAGRTYSVIQKASRLDHRIIPFRYKENHGLAYALNYCLHRARGIYIARQDDDDFSQPDRLEQQVAFLNSHPNISFCGTNATLFDEQGEWGKLIMKERPSSKSFLWNSPFIHPSIMIRAVQLRQVRGYRDSPETVQYEDYDLFFRLYAHGMFGANLQKTLYNYRSDRNAMKYRPLSRRIAEAKLRAKGFQALHLGAESLLYVLKPLILGLVPRHLYAKIQSRRFTV